MKRKITIINRASERYYWLGNNHWGCDINEAILFNSINYTKEFIKIIGITSMYNIRSPIIFFANDSIKIEYEQFKKIIKISDL